MGDLGIILEALMQGFVLNNLTRWLTAIARVIADNACGDGGYPLDDVGCGCFDGMDRCVLDVRKVCTGGKQFI